MIKRLIDPKTHGFTWVDVVGPTEEELEVLAQEFSMHNMIIEESLDPKHLPKIEKVGKNVFFLTRIYDEEMHSDSELDTIVQLTRKLGIWIGEDFLVTIHRRDNLFLESLAGIWSIKKDVGKGGAYFLLLDILMDAVFSYEKPLDDAEILVEEFEGDLLKSHDIPNIIREIYQVKQRVSVIKRMLRQHIDLFSRFQLTGTENPENFGPFLQNLRETTERFFIHSEGLLDEINNLISMHVALASHRTNEVMRFLTIFSVIFMPLTFIVGVYGMNFKYMPELDWKYGYPAVVAVMLGVVVATIGYFRRRGWFD